jgi:hypothetical protein
MMNHDNLVYSVLVQVIGADWTMFLRLRLAAAQNAKGD